MNSDHIPHFKSSPAFNDFQIKLAQEFARFYAEIDRKNLTIQALTEERDELVRMANKLTNERDEARREVCFLLSRNVTQGCDGDTPEFHATARGWCYLLEEDDE